MATPADSESQPPQQPPTGEAEPKSNATESNATTEGIDFAALRQRRRKRKLAEMERAASNATSPAADAESLGIIMPTEEESEVGFARHPTLHYKKIRRAVKRLKTVARFVGKLKVAQNQESESTSDEKSEAAASGDSAAPQTGEAKADVNLKPDDAGGDVSGDDKTSMDTSEDNAVQADQSSSSSSAGSDASPKGVSDMDTTEDSAPQSVTSNSDSASQSSSSTAATATSSSSGSGSGSGSSDSSGTSQSDDSGSSSSKDADASNSSSSSSSGEGNGSGEGSEKKNAAAAPAADGDSAMADAKDGSSDSDSSDSDSDSSDSDSDSDSDSSSDSDSDVEEISADYLKSRSAMLKLMNGDKSTEGTSEKPIQLDTAKPAKEVAKPAAKEARPPSGPSCSLADVPAQLPADTKMYVGGAVQAVVDNTVVVTTLNVPNCVKTALELNSVVFDKDRRPVGRIHDVFGPVTTPLYILSLPDRVSRKSKVEDESAPADASDATSANGVQTNGVSDESNVTSNGVAPSEDTDTSGSKSSDSASTSGDADTADKSTEADPAQSDDPVVEAAESAKDKAPADDVVMEDGTPQSLSSETSPSSVTQEGANSVGDATKTAAQSEVSTAETSGEESPARSILPTEGMLVYFTEAHANFVLPATLDLRGTDASNEDDEEADEEFFSDDEKEREYLQRKKRERHGANGGGDDAFSKRSRHNNEQRTRGGGGGSGGRGRGRGRGRERGRGGRGRGNNDQRGRGRGGRGGGRGRGGRDGGRFVKQEFQSNGGFQRGRGGGAYGGRGRGQQQMRPQQQMRQQQQMPPQQQQHFQQQMRMQQHGQMSMPFGFQQQHPQAPMQRMMAPQQQQFSQYRPPLPMPGMMNNMGGMMQQQQSFQQQMPMGNYAAPAAPQMFQQPNPAAAAMGFGRPQQRAPGGGAFQNGAPPPLESATSLVGVAPVPGGGFGQGGNTVASAAASLANAATSRLNPRQNNSWGY